MAEAADTARVGLIKEKDMDKDRVAGSAKQVKGALKEAVGKVVGDAKLEAEGKGGPRESAKRHRRL